jgi:hypothetical protein
LVLAVAPVVLRCRRGTERLHINSEAWLGDMESIHLQLLIKPTWRHSQGIARITETLASMGLEVSGAGGATVSARSSPDAFRRVFGEEPAIDRSSPSAASLPVPPQLRELVEDVSVAPPHSYMTDTHKRGGSE